MRKPARRFIPWLLICSLMFSLAFALAACAGKAATTLPAAKTGGASGPGGAPASVAGEPADPAGGPAAEAPAAFPAEPAPAAPSAVDGWTGGAGVAEDAPESADRSGGGGSGLRAAVTKDEEARVFELAPPTMAPGASGEAPAKASTPAGSRGGAAAAPRLPASSPGLKAGFADDNRQFNYFTGFLRKYGEEVEHLAIPVDERIILRVQDSAGRPIPNAAVEVSGGSAAGGRVLCRGLTYADGSFLFFPAQYDSAQTGTETAYRAAIVHNQARREVGFDRAGVREVAVRFEAPRPAYTDVPLDILFVLDTTGSMGEEIERLKTTIELIKLNLSSLSSRPRVRFGMVLYRDRGDEYDTRPVPFTEDLDRFQAALDGVVADGGGDDPEDLQAALQEALKLNWSRGGVRLAFIITDAQPHLDYGQGYTYVQAVQDAREKGIKFYSVGTGGLPLMGEYVLRQISQYTAARYIFLTYGEKGEAEGGAPGSVSHHSGANFQTDKLEAIIIRFAKEELASISDQPLEGEDDYFQAVRTGDEQREDTLRKLFTMAVSQLVDYSTFRIPADTPASVLPLSPAALELAHNAEYFTEQLSLSFSQEEAFRKTFRILERRDLQRILDELELQLSGLADERNAAKVGSLLGAKVLVSGRLYGRADGYELFLKLLRVETGEVLAVTKAKIDRQLGL